MDVDVVYAPFKVCKTLKEVFFLIFSHTHNHIKCKALLDCKSQAVVNIIVTARTSQTCSSLAPHPEFLIQSDPVVLT